MKFLWAIFCALLFPIGQAAQTNRLVSPEAHSDGKVTFRLFAPKAEVVSFYGDWMPVGSSAPMTLTTNGVWSLTTAPLRPGIYIYHFNVDGMTIADPVNPKIKLRARTSASLLEVHGNPPGFWEARDVPHGTVEINYHSAKSLGDELRQAWVYKPPGYDKNHSRTYPILYLLHGNNDTAAGWTMVGAANYIMDNLLAEQRAQEMIVVMPFGHAVHFDAPQSEQRNNTPRMEEYVLNDLMPLIEKQYRVRKGRENRAVVGLSMGGGHALHIGLSHLDKFSVVGAFSSAIPNDFETRFASLLSKPTETNKKIQLLWIGCGRQDFAFQRSEQLSKVLKNHGIEHVFHETEGAHTFTVWREYLHEVAPLLFQKQRERR